MVKKSIKVLTYTCMFVLSVNIFNIKMMNNTVDVISNIQAHENNSNYNTCENARKDKYTWKYKVVNKKMYRRLYNNTKRTWAGDWELVS